MIEKNQDSKQQQQQQLCDSNRRQTLIVYSAVDADSKLHHPELL